MKLIKLSLIAASLAFFAIACNNGGSNTNSGSSNANSGPATNATDNNSRAAANTPASPTPATDQFARASAFYGQNCALCHGDTGAGGTVNIEGKKLRVPSLVEAHALKSTDEHFAKQIANGGEGMPAFKDKLKPEEINDMVRFIRQKLQGGAASPGTPSGNNTAPAGKS